MKLTSHDNMLLDRFLIQVRKDNEPTRLAFAMLRAVAVHVRDLQEDDPGDRPRLEVNALERCLQNLGMACADLETLFEAGDDAAPSDALAWEVAYGATKTLRDLRLRGDYDAVFAALHRLGYTEAAGYEFEGYTDQIDMFKRTGSGRRRVLTLMP